MTDEELQRALLVWQQSIQVQEHFNDLEMRVRSFALTLMVALLGATGVVLGDGNYSLAKLLVLGALVSWVAFYMMDRWWYHPLLIGAVRHATEIEKALEADVPQIGLTRAISAASPTVIRKEDKDRNRTEIAIHSSTKMSLFYLVIAAVLIVILGAIILSDRSPDSRVTKTPTPAVSEAVG